MNFLLLALLAPLLGACRGLQSGLEYQYHYEAKTDSSLSSDPEERSGAFLRSSIMVQMTEPGKILIKMNRVQVAERNNKVSCDTQLDYRDMDESDAALLQQPFVVQANVSKLAYLEVPHEPVWVTNIRRGVVNTIPLIVLMGQHPPRLTFFFNEDTIKGRCNNWYSLLKLTGYRAQVENKKLEEKIEVDVQRDRSGRIKTSGTKVTGHKTSSTKKTRGKKGRPSKNRYETLPSTVPHIQDTLSELWRTLDDEHCTDSHFTMKIDEKQESIKRVQRASESLFLLRGEGTVHRLERAVVKGDIIVYTGQSDEEYISTATEQILELRAVRELQSEYIHDITYSTERKPLHFEVERETRRPNLEEKLTGIPLTPEKALQYQSKALEYIKKMTSIDTEEQFQHFFLVTYPLLVDAMTVVTREEIDAFCSQVFSQVDEPEKALNILYQALLASGTDEALVFLLDKMKDRSFRVDHRILVFQFFESITTTIRDPVFFPAVLEVVSQMEEEEEITKIHSLIVLAKLANHHCLNPKTAETCNTACDKDFIIKTFLPILVQGLESPVKWKKLLYLQAIAQLGTPFSLPDLLPLALGSITDDIHLRISAIYCLHADFMPKTAHSLVFDALMPVMNNPAEYPEVRSMAFLIMSTWQPLISWWEHVAISTWHDNSTQMVSFISTFLTSFSKEEDPRISENARKVINLAKHPTNKETYLTLSTAHYMAEFLENCRIGTNLKLAWLATTESLFPPAVIFHLRISALMGETRELRGGIFQYGAQDLIFKMAKATWMSFPLSDQESWETVQEILEELEEDLELQTTRFRPRKVFLLGLLYPIFHYNSGADDMNQSLIQLLVSMMKAPSHFRLSDTTLVLPSDVGFPVVIKHVEDLAVDITFKHISISHAEIYLGVNHENTVEVRTLVPCSEGKTVGAGITNFFGLHLPFNLDLDFSTSSFKVTIGMPPEKKVRLIYWRHAMYTIMDSLYHLIPLPPQHSDYITEGKKAVWRPGGVQRVRRNLFPEIGISLESQWIGDFEKPTSIKAFFREISLLQLGYKNYLYELVLDSKLSSSKEVTFIFGYNKKKEEYVEEPDGQESQTDADYDYTSQVFQSTSSLFDVDVEQLSGSLGTEQEQQQGQQHSQTFNNHMARMQQEMMPATGGEVFTLTMMLEPQNSTRRYEIALNGIVGRKRIREKTTTKLHLTYLNTPRSGIIADTYSTCFDFRTDRAFMSPLLPLEIIRQTSLGSDVLLKMYHGESCEGPPKLRIKGHIEFTTEMMQALEAQLADEACHGSSLRQAYPSYDNFHTEITWTQDLPEHFKINPQYKEQLLQILGLECTTGELHITHPDNNITIDGKLNADGKDWRVTVIGQHRTTTLPHISLPSLPLFHENPINFRKTFDFQNQGLDKVCSIGSHWIKTYDGMSHPFEPSECWTTAAIYHVPEDHANITLTYDMAVQVRFSEEWEVRVLWPYAGIILDLTRSEILVNEEPFSGHSDKFTLYSLEASQMIQTDLFMIWVGDWVGIRVADVYHSDVAGVCGNYDGEPINDMMGPTGCLFTDHSLHTAAWSTKGTGCGRFTISSKKRGLSDFQSVCDKKFFENTGISQHNAMKNCTHWEYPELTTEAGATCKGRVPIPVCQPGCEAGYTNTNTIKYDCWLQSIPGHQQQQQQQHSNLQCTSKIMPINMPSSCAHQ